MFFSVEPVQGYMVNGTPSHLLESANGDTFELPEKTDSEDTSNNEVTSETRQLSEDMWHDAKKRHCEARVHWRSLLNKYVQPH